MSELRKAAQDVVECWFKNHSVQKPIDALAEALQAEPEPVVYMCPSGACKCIWKDNKDGSMSLVINNKPCKICEPLPLSGLVKLYTTPPSVDALIAEIDGMGLHDTYVNFKYIRTILDKYRNVK